MFKLARRPSRRPRPGVRAGAPLTVTPFEERCVPAAGGTAGPPVGPVHTVVYTESNDPRPGENAVLAFRRSPTGTLTRIGRFETGGTGQLNIPKVVGPDDGDQQVTATPDGRFLFAVNQGSDSVTAFRIRPNGALTRIGTFDSGGDQPDSIGIVGTHLYVANRGNAAQGQPATTVSNVTAFDIGPDGSLTPIAGSTISYPLGTFATQTLISEDGQFVFVNLASLEGTADGNTVAPYRILADGRLELAPGGTEGAATTLQLGLANHPTERIVYAGLAMDGRVAVYAYDATGQTSVVGTEPDSGLAPCWLVVSADGRTLYVANTASDAIGVFSLADPRHPVQVQEFDLRGPRFADDGDTVLDTNVFEIHLDPSGGQLYAVNQATKPTFPEGNQFHSLSVGADGLLSEPRDPIIFRQSDVPAIAHPQGVEVVAGRVDSLAPAAAAGRAASRGLVAPPPAQTPVKSGWGAVTPSAVASPRLASGPAPADTFAALIGTGFNLRTGAGVSVDGQSVTGPALGDLAVGL